MVEQYPDLIQVTFSDNPSQDATTGEWTKGTDATYTFHCRAEVNSAARKIPGTDGVMIDFNFICYYPLLGYPHFPIGSSFHLFTHNYFVNGTVKRASDGQLNCRLWL